MYLLTCHITIGSFTFQTVHEVRVQKSVHSYVDTALVKLPATARLQRAGAQETESVETAKQFNQGDPVTIKLGYDNELQEEFTGFVSRVNFCTPCEVECEGYSWQLRNKELDAKEWSNFQVKDFLSWITAGTDITIHPDTPATKADGKLRIFKGESALDALEKLKKDCLLSIYFIGKQLYAGTAYTAQADKSVKYRLGWNTIKDDSLKWRRADDAKVRVVINYKDKKGKTHEKKIGKEGGIVVKMNAGLATDMQALDARAKAKADEHRTPGYEGKITAFLIPFCQHGWKAEVTDDRYPERAGSYLLTSVDVSFGRRGARRIVELGKDLNAK